MRLGGEGDKVDEPDEVSEEGDVGEVVIDYNDVEEGSIEVMELDGIEEELCEDKDNGFRIKDRPRRNIVNALKRWEKLLRILNRGFEAGADDIGSDGFQANKSVEHNEID